MTTRFVTIGSIVLTGLAIAVGAGMAQNVSAGQVPPARQSTPPAATPPCGPNLSDVKNVAKESRCFELRTYVVQPGGAGSIDLLHSRFREHTSRLFVKHGMTIVGFWQPVTKPDTLVYLMAYKDAAARDASWAAFQADPEWVKARTAMQVSVKVDNVFMSATDYSPMK